MATLILTINEAGTWDMLDAERPAYERELRWYELDGLRLASVDAAVSAAIAWGHTVRVSAEHLLRLRGAGLRLSGVVEV
jgi:hypothetical protein